MQEDRNLQPKHQENEVDLGVFFTLIGKLVKKLTAGIKYFFIQLSELALEVLLFIKRKILWLGLGFLVGLSWGLKDYFTKGVTYYSDMVVRSNFESSRELHNQIDHFNSLVKQNRLKDLSTIFQISEKEADHLVSFEITPVDDDIEAAKLYKSTFLEYRRNSINGVDTMWSNTMKFEDFKESLKPYDYPLQKIRLYSYSPNVYSRVQDGLVTAINNNKALQSIKENTTSMLKQEEQILQNALQGLDSLRQAYNKRIELAAYSKPEGNSVFLTDRDVRNPEIDLYDKELIFKDELLNVKRRAIDQQNILEVNAAFNPSGTKVYSLKQDFVKMALWGLLISFVLLVVIELYKVLDRVDKKRRMLAEAGNINS